MGFLTETIYPKPGDFIFTFNGNTFIFKSLFTKDGVRDTPEPRFFFREEVSHILKLYTRYRNEASNTDPMFSIRG